MPEGHTILRLTRTHASLFKGHRLHVDSPQGRFAEGAAMIDGARLVGVEAHGKHSLHRFRRADDAPPRHDLWLHVHLGLFGKWRSGTTPVPEVRGEIRLRLYDDEHWAELRGAIVSEVLDAAGVKALKARLGDDPLKRLGDGSVAYERIHRSSRAVGLLLMDQKVLAGVGNVYRAEILFLHGIDPHRPGWDVTREEWDGMWADLRRLMTAGARSGRIVTTYPADRSRPSGRVLRADAHYVYRRTGLPCRRCGTPVAAESMGKRNLFWCPACQPG